MAAKHQSSTLTGIERTFRKDEVIVSKTDLKGHITYANQVFLRLAGYEEREVMGAPHSLIRHPHMPRCVFKLLWDTVERGQEIFAYVINRSANGDHYWVLAHVTPTFDVLGKITGYHSNRRVADRSTLEKIIIPLYKDLRDHEDQFENRKEGMMSAYNKLQNLLAEKGVSYEQFIFSTFAP